MESTSARHVLCSLVCAVTIGSSALAAQSSARAGTPAPVVRALVSLGGPIDERRQVDEMRIADSSRTLLRSPSQLTLSSVGARARTEWALLLPEVRATWNSRLPDGENDGGVWAGRGANYLVRTGALVRVGPVSLIAAPELTRSENRGFEIFPGRQAGRSAFSSPWHIGGRSADLPLRFGDASLTTLHAGQSSLTIDARAVAFGASTENLWWGPAQRNALVMSDNAEGIPQLFVRTARPLRTRVGTFEARLLIGALTESLFFDTLATNDLRSISAAAVTWRPRFDPDLTVGIARAVTGEAATRGRIAGRFADVLTRWRARRVDDDSASSPPARDQIMSLFARWSSPATGLDVYGEWARQELPRSLRDLLLAPQNTQGYTVGVAEALHVRRSDVLRLELELTNLEQSRTFADRPQPADYYVGLATAQGYTQRGQTIGAALGPGGSSQRLRVDYYASRWQAGLFAGRARYENDALYREFLPNLLRHDVGVFGGARAGLRLPHLDAIASLSFTDRLNYLFQNGAANVMNIRTVDMHNVSFAIDLAPR
jgi:hypothetical protein